MKLWVLAAILTICGTTGLMFTSCQSGARKSSSPEATDMITAASKAKDNERVLSLADSLEKAGKISKGESYYWQGHAHYQMGQREQAKSLWQEAIKVTENPSRPVISPANFAVTQNMPLPCTRPFLSSTDWRK